MDERLKELMIRVAMQKPSDKYNIEQMEETLRTKFNELLPDGYNSFRRNKNIIFELIQTTIDEVAPNRVVDIIGQFAEVKNFPQGQRPIFKLKTGNQRSRRFITRVGNTGVYEVFRLDSRTIEVPGMAHGGAAIIELEEWLDGRVDFAAMTQSVIDEIVDSIYYETIDAITGAISQMPTANRFLVAGFDHNMMTEAINVARAYGTNANIFCSSEFAGTIEPSASFGPVSFSSEKEALEMRDVGYLGKYKGAPVVALPQSFEDRNNRVKVMNPGLALIIPSGGRADEKIVKVSLEGQTIANDYQNQDASMEVQVYKKFGVATITTNYYTAYQNSDLYVAEDGWTEDPGDGVYKRD